MCLNLNYYVTGLPYFKFLNKDKNEKDKNEKELKVIDKSEVQGAKAEKGGAVGHADFARLQRKALEDYLIELIRAVVCTYY